MNRILFAVVLTIGIGGLSHPAGAITITFDPPSLPGGSKSINSWTEKGFIF